MIYSEITFSLSAPSYVSYVQAADSVKTMLKELQKYGSFFSVVNDPKGGSEVLLKLTEKARDEIIDLFYSGKEKRELKHLIKRFDLQLKKG